MLVTSIFAFHKMFTSFPKQTLLFEPSVGSPLQMLSLKLNIPFCSENVFKSLLSQGRYKSG